MRDSGVTLPSASDFIVNLLVRALGRRVKALTLLPSTHEIRGWALDAVPTRIDQSEVRIGLNLNVESYGSIIEKGPAPEDQDQVAEFRRFWGSK